MTTTSDPGGGAGSGPRTGRCLCGRCLCGRCGSPMAYESERFPGEIHLYAASLDEAGRFAPESHVHYAERLPWFDVRDDLPRHPASDDLGSCNTS